MRRHQEDWVAQTLFLQKILNSNRKSFVSKPITKEGVSNSRVDYLYNFIMKQTPVLVEPMLVQTWHGSDFTLYEKQGKSATRPLR